jgi:CPA2 family monovalent cation:H+ antiporter-2
MRGDSPRRYCCIVLAALESVLLELALLFALCVFAGVLFLRFRMPPIVGFLAIGALVGPHAIGLVQNEETVEQLAEVGVVVLLFAVGMELPLGQLARLKRTILLGGGVQILGTVLTTALLCWAFGLEWNQSLFVGFLLSLSSTAAVTKILVDHGEFSAPHGRLSIGIAIAQDLAVVPMILLIPMLVGAGDAESGGIVKTLENFVILLVVWIAAHFSLPRILDLVCRTRSRELFVLTLATLCLSMAVVTAHLGMSMALGAFLAGILLADSDYHGQAAAEVEPFRDALASLFFVSIGMLFDAGTILQAPWLVSIALLAVLVGKAAVIFVAGSLLGQPGWVRLRAGLLMAQVGEFSFVLVQVGGSDVLSPMAEKVFLVVAVLSIASTPALHALGRAVVVRARGREGAAHKVTDQRQENHAVVIGYGPSGRTVVQAMRALNLPVTAIEMNANTVKVEKAKGVPIVFGDATRVAVLKSLGVERARTVIVAINDMEASRRITQLVRQVAPQTHIVARAVYISEIEGLMRAGAHEVVPQELEASIEILVRTLRRFLIADDEVGRQVQQFRAAAGGIEKAGGVSRLGAAQIAEFVPGLGVGIFRVEAGATAIGKSLAEVGVRRRTACTIVTVRRGSETLAAVTPETQLQHDDVVVVIGPEDRLPDVEALLHAPADSVHEEPAEKTDDGAPLAESNKSN